GSSSKGPFSSCWRLLFPPPDSAEPTEPREPSAPTALATSDGCDSNEQRAYFVTCRVYTEEPDGQENPSDRENPRDTEQTGTTTPQLGAYFPSEWPSAHANPLPQSLCCDENDPHTTQTPANRDVDISVCEHCIASVVSA